MPSRFQHSFSVRILKVAAVWISMVLVTTLSSAQDYLGADFSQRLEIEKRLATAKAKLRNLTDSNPVLHDRLQQLAETCQYHPAATDILAKAKSAQDQPAQAFSSWSGFTQEAHYSLLLLDEIRQTLANLKTSQHAEKAQHAPSPDGESVWRSCGQRRAGFLADRQRVDLAP
jgi:hypothetical protein